MQELQRDLDWREAEIAMMRLFLTNSTADKLDRTVLLRASWALLYAHFEGFSKFALTVYYDNLQRLGVKCGELAPSTQAFALASWLKETRSATARDFVSRVRDFEASILMSAVSFPEVQTNSNLWPQKLDELLQDADLSVQSLEKHYNKLKTLVARRNKIAHGEQDLINELPYYISYENAVIDVLYELAFAIDEKLTQGFASQTLDPTPNPT